MAQLVRQGAEAEQAVAVAHENEGVGAHPAGGKLRVGFSLVGVDVDPALLQAAAAQDTDIFLAERRQPGADPIHGLREGDARLVAGERRPDVVGLQRLHPERSAPDGPVAVPGGQIFLEGVDEIVEHLDRQVVLEQRRF